MSNEVGGGIVPDNALARRYSDAHGILNQRVAAAVGRVVLMDAGLPLLLKPSTARNHHAMNHRIPATVVTGFLGAGKTTLIRNLDPRTRAAGASPSSSTSSATWASTATCSPTAATTIAGRTRSSS